MGIQAVEQPPEILDTRQAAELSGYSVATLSWWRCQRDDGPRFRRLPKSGRVFYMKADLLSWLAALPVHRSTREYLDRTRPGKGGRPKGRGRAKRAGPKGGVV